MSLRGAKAFRPAAGRIIIMVIMTVIMWPIIAMATKSRFAAANASQVVGLAPKLATTHAAHLHIVVSCLRRRRISTNLGLLNLGPN